ncbi:Predicted N-acetyltransferase YhbS [Litoreibacter janthinus]|uniref:Predicted N-acetyltransferase YhbS n=1 Tax=Litoreibacter janthinus TaxID=670154 RepID=A0A1I6FU22_9RHOB|nr:Predicted N-acetyltransferase YhbS [Litoreibacter janthinus]
MSAVFKAAPDYDPSALLTLIRLAFEEQKGRIDPPSSMNKLRPPDIAAHLAQEMVFVVEQEGAPVACLFGTRKPGALYVSKLSVRPDHRGGGLARALLNAAEGEARVQGLQHLELISRRELTDNHALFRHLGFEKFAEGSHPGYDTVTEFHFRKML